MKKLFTVCALFLLSGSLVYSQLLLEENFDYTAGDSLTAHGWVQHSAGASFPEIFVTTPGLSYTGYAGSGVGNAATLNAGTGQDVNRSFTSQTSGAVYTALLVNVASATTTGDYFFHLASDPITGNIFRGRLHVKRDASNNVAFGISFKGTNPVFTNLEYVLGTTYLLVVKSEFGQNAKLFVNPTIGGSEPAATVTSTDFDSDPANYALACLRQGGGSSAPQVTVDGIRIATTWAGAVAGGGSTANQPPVISGFTRDPEIPVNEALVSATVTDDHNVVLPVRLIVSSNGVLSDSMDMDLIGPNTYEAEIPAKSNGTYVTYVIRAKDDSNATTISSAQRYFSGTTPINNLRQYNPNGVSLYDGMKVRVRGIVTAGDSTYSASNIDIYIQDATSGINIFKTGWVSYPEGRDLTVEGTVYNFNGKLELFDPTITNNGTGAIPAATVINAAQLESETYEGRLVTVTGLTFSASGIFDSTGQLRFGGTTYYCNGLDSIVVNIDRQLWDEFHGFAIPSGAINVRGIASQRDFSSPFTSGYELTPRKTADVNVGGVSVDDNNPVNPKEFSLSQNFPNPFNPTTTISYEVPKASDISIKIYNLLGQEIRTLFSGKQNAGKHVINWDGKDNIGKAVSTGIYFYRLNAPNFVQTRKMIMIK